MTVKCCTKNLDFWCNNNRLDRTYRMSNVIRTINMPYFLFINQFASRPDNEVKLFSLINHVVIFFKLLIKFR